MTLRNGPCPESLARALPCTPRAGFSTEVSPGSGLGSVPLIPTRDDDGRRAAVAARFLRDTRRRKLLINRWRLAGSRTAPTTRRGSGRDSRAGGCAGRLHLSAGCKSAAPFERQLWNVTSYFDSLSRSKKSPHTIACACLAPDARGLRFARAGRVPPARAARCLPCACTPCGCSPVRGRTADESINQTTPRSIRAARRGIGGEPDSRFRHRRPSRGPRRAAALN